MSLNAENQQVSMDGGAATYAYDGEGRRMKKTTSTETMYTFYGPGGVLCEFSTVNTGATAAASTDRTLYRTSERTGTAVLLFTTAGAVIENNRTLPYGEAWLSDVASANDKRFTTYDRDKESGLDYAMARMYANMGGRFTSPDRGPHVLYWPGSLNRYIYGGSDPVNHTDPSGNQYVNVTGPPPPPVPLDYGSRNNDNNGLPVEWLCQYLQEITVIVDGYERGTLSDLCSGIGTAGETPEEVAEPEVEECRRLKIDRCDFRFSRKDVRAWTSWSDSSLKRHLRRLEDLEYLAVHRGGRGQSFVYELVFVPGDPSLETPASPD